MNLSAHFSLGEFTRSDEALRRGIDNSAPDEVLDNLYDTAAGLERVRTVLGTPIIISSGYRCPKLNTAVHGSKNSQHLEGKAADIRSPAFGTPLQVCREIAANADFVDFDQLLMEGQWTHISFSENPRGQILTAHFDNGRVTYTKGLP